MKLLILFSFEEYLLAAYALVGMVSAVGYGPQIWTLIVSTGRSKGTPISTWSLWAIEACVTFAYAIFILKNTATIILVGVDLLAAVIITILTIYNRFYRFRTVGADLPTRPLQNAA